MYAKGFAKMDWRKKRDYIPWWGQVMTCVIRRIDIFWEKSKNQAKDLF